MILVLDVFVSVLSAFPIMMERQFQIRWEFSTRALISPHSQIPFAEYKCRTIIIASFHLDCVELKKLTFTIDRFAFFSFVCISNVAHFFWFLPMISDSHNKCHLMSYVRRYCKLFGVTRMLKKISILLLIALAWLHFEWVYVCVWKVHSKYKARQSEKSWRKSKYKSCAFYSDAHCHSTFENLVNWIILPMWSGYVRLRLDFLPSGTVVKI